MSSGYFPLSSNEEWGKKLLEAKKLISEVIEEHWECISDLNSEDAYSDGLYVGDLINAKQSISNTVKQPEV